MKERTKERLNCLIFVTVCIVILAIITVPRFFMTGREQYEEATQNLQLIAESEEMKDFRLKCEKALEDSGINVEESAIKVGTLDAKFYIDVLVLTEDDEFITFNVSSNEMTLLARNLELDGQFMEECPRIKSIEVVGDKINITHVDD